MKRIAYLSVIIFLIFLGSCDYIIDDTPEINKVSISGIAQKGPMIIGSTVDLYELNEDLGQTGKVFNTQIMDNAGNFEISDVELASKYVQLIAEGYYFNEVLGDISSSQIKLYSLADISDSTTVNVNLLTHLERGRIIALQKEGASYTDARQQAQDELLKIFYMELEESRDARFLDISSNEEDNAILLAISVIIQGFRSDADLSELLANFALDFSSDGILDDSGIISDLVNDVALMQFEDIRSNLDERYDELGMDISFPDFEKYLTIFLDSSDLSSVKMIEYPVSGDNGLNILNKDVSKIIKHQVYSFAAVLPTNNSLKIRMSGGLWSYTVLPVGPVNWNIDAYNWDTNSQNFTSKTGGTNCDAKLRFEGPDVSYDSTTMVTTVRWDTILVEYFENLSETPTFTKILTYEE